MTTTPTRPAASRHNSDFARAAVYLEFRGRDARHLDQTGFVDRRPDQVPCTCAPPTTTSGAAILERLAVALSQVGGEAST